MSEEIKNLSACALGTITTGSVLVHGFEGVGEAFEHVMGHPVWTHEMPMLGDRAKALILEQRPNFPADKPDDWKALAESLAANYPDGVPIRRGNEVRPGDPISTVAMALGRAKDQPQ